MGFGKSFSQKYARSMFQAIWIKLLLLLSDFPEVGTWKYRDGVGV